MYKVPFAKGCKVKEVVSYPGCHSRQGVLFGKVTHKEAMLQLLQIKGRAY